MSIVRCRAFSRSTFFAHGSVVEGEDTAAFDDLYDQLFAAIRPNDVIDEMYVADIVADEWELLRWRRIKSTILSQLRSRALRSFLEENIEYRHFQKMFQEEVETTLREHITGDAVEEIASRARKWVCAVRRRGDRYGLWRSEGYRAEFG